MAETISITALRMNAKNIREKMDPKFIERLADSIRRYGIRTPITVTKSGIVVAGNQRFVAAKKAGVESLVVGRDVVVMAEDDQRTIDEVNAIENVMRRNLNPFEEAEGLRRIIVEHDNVDARRLPGIASTAYQMLTQKHELTGKHLAVVKTMESLGFAASEGVLLLRIDTMEAKAKAFLKTKAVASWNRIGLTKLAAIAQLPAADQYTVARTVVARGISVKEIPRRYRLWKEGKIGSDLMVKRSENARSRLYVFKTADQLDAIGLVIELLEKPENIRNPGIKDKLRELGALLSRSEALKVAPKPEARAA